MDDASINDAMWGTMKELSDFSMQETMKAQRKASPSCFVLKQARMLQDASITEESMANLEISVKSFLAENYNTSKQSVPLEVARQTLLKVVYAMTLDHAAEENTEKIMHSMEQASKQCLSEALAFYKYFGTGVMPPGSEFKAHEQEEPRMNLMLLPSGGETNLVETLVDSMQISDDVYEAAIVTEQPVLAEHINPEIVEATPVVVTDATSVVYVQGNPLFTTPAPAAPFIDFQSIADSKDSEESDDSKDLDDSVRAGKKRRVVLISSSSDPTKPAALRKLQYPAFEGRSSAEPPAKKLSGRAKNAAIFAHAQVPKRTDDMRATRSVTDNNKIKTRAAAATAAASKMKRNV